MPIEIDQHLLANAIPPFISGIISFVLGILVLTNNPKNRINIFFSLLMLACAVWPLNFAAMAIMSHERHAFLFARMMFTAVVLIPAFYYSFIVYFLGLIRQRRALFTMYLFSAVFLIALWSSGLMVSGTIRYSWGFSSKANWLLNLFLVYFFAVFLRSFVELFKTNRYFSKQDPQRANRIRYSLLSFVIAILASADFLPAYGIGMYPIGFIFMIAFAIITSYAIVRHKLLDISFVIKKGALYSATLGIMLFVFIMLVLTVEQISRLYFKNLTENSSVAIFIVCSLPLIPVFSILSRYLNKLFFKATPDELSELNIKLIDELQDQDRMKSVATLAAGMAHEIKNPLTSIKTFAEHLPEKYNNESFRATFSRIIPEEIDKINTTVSQLLSFAKPPQPVLQIVNINNLISDTLNLLNNSISQNKIEVIKQYDNTLPSINLDATQIKQAFLNIVLNAIEAMPDGGKLTIKTGVNQQGKTNIQICDTGPGISKSDLNRALDPFFTTKEKGTGLGLSIAFQIIQKHDGQLRIASNKDGPGITVAALFP